jgi:hypothetical protein
MVSKSLVVLSSDKEASKKSHTGGKIWGKKAQAVAAESKVIDLVRDDVETECRTLETDASIDDTVQVEEREAQELLEKYGFGSGMRMYAKSVALAAAQMEQEEAATTAANEEVAVVTVPTDAVTEAAAPTVEAPVEGDTIPMGEVAAPKKEKMKLNLEIPSFLAVRSRESVKKALTKDKTSSPRKTSSSKKERFPEDEDADEEESVEDASIDTKASGVGCMTTADWNAYYQQGEAALTDLFRQAEEWVATTHNTMFPATEQQQEVVPKKKSKSFKWWKMLQPKPEPLAEQSLSLDEGCDQGPADAAAATKGPEPEATSSSSWWSAWFAPQPSVAAAAVTEETKVSHETKPSSDSATSVDGDQTAPTSKNNEQSKAASEPSAKAPAVAPADDAKMAEPTRDPSAKDEVVSKGKPDGDAKTEPVVLATIPVEAPVVLETKEEAAVAVSSESPPEVIHIELEPAPAAATTKWCFW